MSAAERQERARAIDAAARAQVEAWDELWRAMFPSFFEDETGAPALRLVSGADAPDEGSLDGNQDEGT